MSDEKHLDKFIGELLELPKNMRLFSLSLRSLYSVNNVGSSTDAGKQIIKMRDNTREDAMVYVKGVLPISTQVVRSVQSYFEYYTSLSMEEWKENLADILDEVQGYKQCCSAIVRLHENIMIPLKKRQDEASVLLDGLESLTEEFEKRKADFEASASTKRSFGVALSFIPGINIVAGPILGILAESDMAQAVATEQQGKINEATIRVVKDTMIPALSAFLDGLSAAAGFFSVIENEIEIFHTKGEAAKLNATKLHYIMMKKKAQEVEDNCRAFYAMLPGVRTDLESIPENPDDQNYVDKWLAKQKKEIEQKYGAHMNGGLRKLIKHFTSKGAGELMIT